MLINRGDTQTMKQTCLTSLRALSCALEHNPNGVDLQAKPALVVTQKGPIRVPDIQALVLWVLADRKEGKNPGWAFVKVCFQWVPAVANTQIGRKSSFLSRQPAQRKRLHLQISAAAITQSTFS